MPSIESWARPPGESRSAHTYAGSWFGTWPAAESDGRFPNGGNMAKTNAAETYRGPLLALVEEVRRLRGILLDGGEVER